MRQPGILLPYFLDTEAFNPDATHFREEHRIPEDVFLVGRLGKTDWKFLCHALACVMKQQPNVWFVTVDDYSSSSGNLSLCRKFANRIVHIPRLNGTDELRQFYSACDITLNFSPIGESFGYGIAESMSCGTPAVVLSTPTRDNAQIELAAQEHGGFPVGNADSAAQLIIQLASQRPLLDAARAKCRTSIEQRYSRQVVAPQVLKTYELLHSSSQTGTSLEHLFQEHGFTTHIPTQEIFRQLSGVHPAKNYSTRLKIALWHILRNIRSRINRQY